MVKVVFVGDEPSQTNIDPDIAFVGAKCFPRLVGWIKELDIDYYICLNSTTDSDIFKIERLVEDGFKVIALGKKASKRLVNNQIWHHPMPHPSGLNFKLNDPKYIALEIMHCYEYVHNIKEKASGAV